jgi:CrcB protein
MSERPAWQRRDVLLAVAAGGLLGAPARYGVGQLLPTPKHGFPWSTLLVNVSGALLLGILLVLLLERFPPNRYARAFLGTGFLGAYTTFSTYMVETALLAKDGYVERATAYLLGSLVVGLFAAWLGIVIGRTISSLGRGGDGGPANESARP